MVWLDRNGANLLHASLAGSGKDSIQLAATYDDDHSAQHEPPDVPLLLLWP